MSNIKSINKTNNFDLIRLLAALQVVFTHSQLHFELNGGILEKIGKHFLFYFPGVPVFFTVSGFLIFWSFERSSNTIKSYFRNRFLRLYPALWVCFLITVCLLVYDYKEDISNLITNKTFYLWILAQISVFQFWTPDILRFWGVGTPNGSLWTIIVEIQFYLLVPIIYFFTNFFYNFKILVLIIIIIISLLFNYYAGQFPMESIQYKLSGVCVLPFLYNFLFGVAAYLYWDKIKKIIENKFFYWLGLYIVYIIVLGNLYDIDLNSYFLNNPFQFVSNIILAGLVLSAAFSYNQISNKLLKHNDISYGVYIYHMLIINYFVNRGLLFDVKYFILTFILTIIMAFCSWTFVEKRFLKLKKT